MGVEVGGGAVLVVFFFFQAEDGIRDSSVTGVQTCALPIFPTLTPCCMYFLTGAIPDARRMFEQGQCATPHPVLAICLISSTSTQTAWANQTSSPSQPSVPIQSLGRS